MTCPIPRSHHGKVPSSVSLVAFKCARATNNMVVNYQVPTMDQPKQQFGVCVKGLTVLDDISVQLIEWIETVKAYGADKIFFYLMEVNQNVSKVNPLRSKYLSGTFSEGY